MKFKMIHQVDKQTILDMYENYAPVFILSTGRSGSKFLAELLDISPNIKAFHEPRPTLEYFANYAFHKQEELEILANMFQAARMESILEINIQDNIYIESNQCLVFFAPVIARLFKKARFVHVVRHPGDFVRSALRKGWYLNDTIWECGRLKMIDELQWIEMDQIEQLSWLWNATNQFIENFKNNIPGNRIAFFKLEDLVKNVKVVKELLHFSGGNDIPVADIEKMQATKINELYIAPDEPANMKKIDHFPHYDKWPNELKEKLKKHTYTLASVYGYCL